MHVLLLWVAAASSPVLVLLHHLYVILDTFELLLKEALLLSNCFYLKSITKQRIHLHIVNYVRIVQRLSSLVSVKFDLLLSISNGWHIVICRAMAHSDLMRFQTGSLISLVCTVYLYFVIMIVCSTSFIIVQFSRQVCNFGLILIKH